MSSQDFQTLPSLNSGGICGSSAPGESTLHLEDEPAHSLRFQRARGKRLASQVSIKHLVDLKVLILFFPNFLKTYLPSEIIYLIFERAIPPYSLLDTSLAAGPHSSWCQNIRLLKSITLVSHSWYDVGVRFLYKDICIRRTAQLERLHQALAKSSLQQLYLLVKSIELQCLVPKDFSSKFSADLDAIINLCPALSKFAYITPSPLPPTVIRPASLVPRITHLRLDGIVHYKVLVTILHEVRASLFVLQVRIDYNEYLESGGEPVPTTTDGTGSSPTLTSRQVSLPFLQTLSVTDAAIKAKLDVLSILKDHWIMPLLRRATIYAYNTFIYSKPTNDLEDESITKSTVSFLKVHGHGLHFLHIGFPYVSFQAAAFQSLLGHCPLLERLVIHPCTFDRMKWARDRISHPNLRWIDLTYNFRSYTLYGDSCLCLAKGELPKLVGVRRICNLPGYYFNWLDKFHPPHDAELQEDFTLDVFDSRLVCRGGRSYWNVEPIVETSNSDGTSKPVEFDGFSECEGDDESSYSDYADDESSNSDYGYTSDDDSTTDSSSSCGFASGDEEVLASRGRN